MFNKLNILSIFFESPTKEFNVREIARLVKITPATVSKRLKKLASKGFIKYRKERLLDLYKANLDSDEYLDLKVYYNIRRLRETDLIKAINEQYLKPTIILFGSGIKGLDVEDSDMDLVIISENTEQLKNQKLFEKKLKRSLQLFPIKELKDLRNNHLINNVLNGMVLQGELEWI